MSKRVEADCSPGAAERRRRRRRISKKLRKLMGQVQKWSSTFIDFISFLFEHIAFLEIMGADYTAFESVVVEIGRKEKDE
jgi:hypothetical protein